IFEAVKTLKGSVIKHLWLPTLINGLTFLEPFIEFWGIFGGSKRKGNPFIIVRERTLVEDTLYLVWLEDSKVSGSWSEIDTGKVKVCSLNNAVVTESFY